MLPRTYGAEARILDYQRRCTIQIQENTRQHVQAATKTIMDYLKVCTTQIQENNRQVDAVSDKQVADQVDALEKGLNEKLEELKKLETAGAPPVEPEVAGGNG